MAALAPVVYGIAGLAAFVLLLAAFRLVSSVIDRFRKANRPHESEGRRVDEFLSEAGNSNISVRVAREGHELLSHYYPDGMSVDLNHDLRDGLKLTDDDIVQLYAGLLSRTERREMRSLTADNINTVYDLLDYVEKAPAQQLDGVAVRVRATDIPSAERGTAYGSGMFLREGAPGQTRRSTDYIGPRRRASDNKIKRAYSGPHRRATDLQVARSASPIDRSGEQKAAEPEKHSLVLIPPRTKQPVN